MRRKIMSKASLRILRIKIEEYKNLELACVANVPQAANGASDVVEQEVMRGAVTATATGVKSKSREVTDAQVLTL